MPEFLGWRGYELLICRLSQFYPRAIRKPPYVSYDFQSNLWFILTSYSDGLAEKIAHDILTGRDNIY